MNLRSIFLRKKSLFAILVGSVLGFFSIDGVDYATAISLYLEKCQELSYHTIDAGQLAAVREAYLRAPSLFPDKETRRKVREAFHRRERRQMKKFWVQYYRRPWPVYRCTTCCRTHKNCRGKDLEAHHILPIYAGGVNTWVNISPLTYRNHTTLHRSLEEKACFTKNPFLRKGIRLFFRAKRAYLARKNTAPTERAVMRFAFAEEKGHYLRNICGE